MCSTAVRWQLSCFVHTEQPINYWNRRLKIAPRASGHVSLTCTESIALVSPPGCYVSLYSLAGRQPSPRMAHSSELPRLQAEILLTHHPLGWQLQGAAVEHTHTAAHTACDSVFTPCDIHVVCRPWGTQDHSRKHDSNATHICKTNMMTKWANTYISRVLNEPNQ